jgi:hypothetical protein
MLSAYSNSKTDIQLFTSEERMIFFSCGLLQTLFIYVDSIKQSKI